MADSLQQRGAFAWVLKAVRTAVFSAMAFLALAVIATVALAVTAALDAVDTGRWIALVPFVLAFVGELVGAIWLFAIYGVVQVLVANEAAVSQTTGRLKRIETLLEDQGRSAKRLIDLASLSDQAKSIIHRDKEIEALREVIHDDMMRQDYQTAEAMIEMVEKRLGYADEGARLRRELDAARKDTLEEKIDRAIIRIKDMIEKHDWPRALRAAQRLEALFPDNAKVAELPRRVLAERTKHKRQLLQEYGEAVRKNDVDKSIELLRRLDRHLTPQEAAALEESARGVFRAKLHNLGVQFAICVTDERWAEAVATGEEITREFPNSRMSQEVNQKMPQLRARAAEAAAAK